jgi:hypothetical protein
VIDSDPSVKRVDAGDFFTHIHPIALSIRRNDSHGHCSSGKGGVLLETKDVD